MNPKTVSYIELLCFVAIAALSPVADKLASAEALNTRSIIAMIVFASIAGFNAAKAYFSQSSQQLREPQTITVPVEKPTPVVIEPQPTKPTIP